MTFVCVLPDTATRWRECLNCGGSTSAIDAETGVAGPFPGDDRYCSEDCAEDAHEYAARAAEQRRRQIATCPGCGFDNQEHDPYCGWLVVLDL